VIQAFTEPTTIQAGKLRTEPTARDVVFTGTNEEVNDYFYEQGWSDGLPIIPPTLEKVEEFLRYTPLSADAALGVLPPANREATVWNVAVNGVMAGCRPEYMPVLVAIAEAMADPRFSIKDAGSTGGWEVTVILNGPVMRQLGFNFGVAMLRAGARANTSVARFTRMYMRNIAGLLPGVADMSTQGRNYFPPVIVEDEVYSPWQPLSVDLGFKKDSNVVTLQGHLVFNKIGQQGGKTATEMLDMIAAAMVNDFLANGFASISSGWGPENHDMLVMGAIVAKKIAEQYTKQQAKEYLFKKARVTAKQFEEVHWYEMATRITPESIKAAAFYESDSPDRLVPLYHDANELFIIVAGDYARNRCFTMRGIGRMGLATSKEVKLPTNWSQLVPAHLP
jgi:hypothetical protein